MRNNNEFVNSLRKGDAVALQAFYELLVTSGDDEEFWNILRNLAEVGQRLPGLANIDALRTSTRQTSYERFMLHSPKGVVVSFLLAAMLYSGCSGNLDGNSADNQVTGYSPVGNAPPSVQVHPYEPVTAKGENAESDSHDTGLETKPEPVPPASAQVRLQLLEYISRAQLPAREKREMKKVVRESADSEIIDTQGDLERLLKTENPQKIARILEATALLKSVAKKDKWNPAFGARYKAASFEWDDA